MLIQTSANCKNYKEVVREGFHGGLAHKGEFVCPDPDCRCDVFHIHATYERSVLTYDPIPDFILSDTQELVEIKLELLRVKCAGCGTTHVIAPVDMIPFKSFTITAFLLLLLQSFLKDESNRNRQPVLHPRKDVSWLVLHRMLLIYQDCRSRMMAALRIENLHTAAADLADSVLVKVYLTHHPPSEAQLAYLRCHKHVLCTFPQNKGSRHIPILLPRALFG